jgi:PAS domain S-box-containing protein
MGKKDAIRLDPADLRRRAEELLRGKPADLAAIPAEESRRLLHELRVHQIELEMQNDELRKAQSKLETSRVKYFDLYDMAPVGYFTVGEDGSILEANLRAAQLLGVERNRLVTQPLTRFIVPEDQDVHYLHRKRVLETGLRQECDLRMSRQDGSRSWVHMEADAVRDGEDGPPVFRIMVSDITERKRAEEKLIYIMKAVESASDAIGISDSLGHHFYQNKALSDLFGFATAEELESAGGGKAVVKDPEVAREMFGNIMSGKPWVGELEMVTKSGSVFPAFERADAIKDLEGNLIGFIGIITDITDRRRAEEEKRKLEEQVRQAQKLESLGVLAGGIAHDFNNLLMVVLGHAEMALKWISPTSAARRNLAEIITAVERAAGLCSQMLAYAGKSSFALEPVGLRELVEEMEHLLKITISKKAILNLNLERGLPPIEADPSQIRQITMNLIINASEAIGNRSGVITVSVGATRCDAEYLQKTEVRDLLTPGLYVHLEVTDTGIGMDAETRSRIFEPFFSTKFTGRGLGLAAVQGIVRSHKGAMKVYSEPGKGTTFKVLFPALTERGDAIRSPESSPLADWRGKGTILLVDDEESLIALGVQMLEHLGFAVLTAADGHQAVELYRERGKEIDLVLMDLTMPNMDGAKAFGELRRLNPDVRVVLASGYTHDEVASRFVGKNIDGVLQKPYTLARLRESLAGLLPERPDGEE